MLLVSVASWLTRKLYYLYIPTLSSGTDQGKPHLYIRKGTGEKSIRGTIKFLSVHKGL